MVRNRDRLTLRVRLTLWYVLLLAVTLVVFGSYVHLQLERSVLSQTDSTLRTAADQIADTVNTGSDSIAFGTTASDQENARRLEQAGFAARLLTLDGGVRDGFGSYVTIPVRVPAEPGFRTAVGDGIRWRIYSRPIVAPDGQRLGWLQVAQSLNPVQDVLETLLRQTLLGLPLVLLLAAVGGLLLARRALLPIERVTRTAQAVSARDLTQRIDYRGPADEVGQLATTFDGMLDRLETAFDRERRFTADASHELRTPLTALKGRIEVTRSRLRSPAEYDRALEEMGHELERLIRLANDLLFLSRLEQTRSRLQLHPLDLSDLLETLGEQTGPMLAAHTIAFTMDIAPDLLIDGDVDHLTRLFLNLLDNAGKYTPTGGQVTLLGYCDGAGVYVAVSDTGPGIPADALPHLFERFYRVEADRSRETGGAGLGLAIAYEIARSHRGTVTAENRPTGGALFAVHLPAGHQATPPAPIPQPSVAPTTAVSPRE